MRVKLQEGSRSSSALEVSHKAMGVCATAMDCKCCYLFRPKNVPFSEMAEEKCQN